MSRKSKIIIFSIILIFAVYQKQFQTESKSFDSEDISNKVEDNNSYIPSIVDENKNDDVINFNLDDSIYERPSNGFSPYDSYFGRGIYNNSVSNYVEIDNQTSNDAVVLLVNAYTEKKIRNEYVRKGTKFKMTGVPDGVYYIRMMSGNNWNPNLQVGPLKGGFSKNRSISGNSDSNDWMKIGTTYADSDGIYYEGFSQTLHGVVGGDVESESLTANEFAN